MKNKSIYFIYDAKNCTPNGDPDNDGQRFNELTRKACVSDLRIKRFGRDKLNEIGIPIFYFYDKDTITVGDVNVSGAVARYKQFCVENNVNETESIDSEKVLLQNFIDVRVFGGILTASTKKTEKIKKANIMGALQFDAETNSINDVLPDKNLVNRAITTVFPSNDENTQGSIGRDTFLRYGLFCVKGRFSANAAKINNTTDVDLNVMLSAIWDGMKTKNSRSKFGHEPIACIVVEHPTKETKNGFLGSIFSKSFMPFIIKSDKKLSDLYERNDYEFDFTPLFQKLNTNEVENITIYCDNTEIINKYFLNLPNNCQILNPLDVLISNI